jgi:hypothetical protein
MKTEKQFFLLATLFIFLISADAVAQMQLRAGVKVAPGFGFIKSRNLKKIYNDIEENYPGEEKATFNATARVGNHLTFGGFADYKYNEEFFFMVEPTFTYSFNRIILNSRIEDLDEKGTGTVTNISSEAKIRAAYFSLPLSVKYRFNQRKDFFALGGFAFNFHFTPTLKSNEQIVTLRYLSNEAFETTRDEIETKVKLRGYRLLNVNAFIGVGKVLNPYGRNIIVDVRYSVPLSKSPLYVEGGSSDKMIQNNVFTEEGKNQINSTYPQYPLRDFRMGVLQFSVSVALYKNYR